MTHQNRWLHDLMDSMDEKLEEESKKRVLESVGRRCISPEIIEKAKEVYEQSKDLDDFSKKYAETNSHFQKEGDDFFVIYPECYCPNIKNLPNITKLPDTYCYCSVGWVKELFESAIGKEVEVERVYTVVSGEDECKFKVYLKKSHFE